MRRDSRFEPGLLRRSRAVPRPRLTRELRRRFDHRLTLVVGAAGSGKTTALSNAVESNRLDPIGIDLWLAATEPDADPAHFTSSLCGAVGAEASGTSGAVEAIADAVWSRAPDDVAIIVDDVHLLSDDSTAVLQRLLSELPRNGHLVLSSRSQPSLPIARLRSHGEVVHIDETDLVLTDDELLLLADAHGTPAAAVEQLPRLPALADLSLTAGHDASIDYLWEEVLDDLEPGRLRGLIYASVVERLDDDTARALTSDRFDASALVGDLPLIESFADGTYRLHALLRSALADRLRSDERAKAARIAADLQIERGRLGAAVRLLAEGGEYEAAIATARRYVVLPTLHTPLPELLAVRRTISSISPQSALTELLAAHCLLGNSSADALGEFSRIADLARSEGDLEVETVALHRTVQMSFTMSAMPSADQIARLDELEELVPFAAGVNAHLRSALAQGRGDAEASRAEIDRFDSLDQMNKMVLRAERLCDLGLVEDVALGLEVDDLGSLPEGGEIFIAFAMWLRGEAPPELALEIVTDMVHRTLTRRIAQTNTSILTVASSIAATAGRADLAASWSEQARQQAALDPANRMMAFGELASAMAALAANDVDAEERARAAVARSLDVLPMNKWPERCHLMALPMLHVLAPDTRATIESCPFGPSLQLAVAAGKALSALRDSGDAGPAAALDWSNPALLRVHVLPVHLAELAAAAAATGDSDTVSRATSVLDQLPQSPQLLRRCLPTADGPTAQWIEHHLASVPPEPTSTISIRTLGPLTLLRDGVEVSDDDWVRRTRVRELLAWLVEHRRGTRSEIGLSLWPDLDGDKINANLRVTLSYLQKVLEPDRPREVPPAFVQSSGDLLELSDLVDVDSARFDTLMKVAQDHDRNGAPREACSVYEAALELAEGAYLDGHDAAWAFSSRLRFQALSVGAACRVGELTLARGEPDDALAFAVRAERIAPHSERARRLFISCLSAAGDRSAALAAADELTTRLAASGLSPEPETAQLILRLNSR